MLLESKRLFLRRFNIDDKDDLFEYLSDNDVVSFEPYQPFTQEMMEEEIKARVDNPSFIAVCLKDTNKLIGNLYFSKVEPHKVNTYEIGYVFNKNYHSMGYATEAVECLLEYLFYT